MAKLNNSKRAQSLIQLTLVVVIVLLANILSSFIYSRLDLTEEKRFSLTPATKQILEDLDDVVTVRILFAGEFPAGMKRLQKTVQETLGSFRAESGYIEYEFEDPYEGDAEEVNGRLEELKKDGIGPIDMRFVDVDGTKEVFGYPYAVFYYKGRMMPVNFLENVPTLHQERNLENSISLLEYKFANAIQKLQSERKKNILFTTGHGELEEPQLVDLRRNLGTFYNTGMLNLDSVTVLPAQAIACLIVAKPRTEFTDRHKFIIDQYVMNGGKVLWLIDKLNATLDSMIVRSKYVPPEFQLNLDDILFKYGVRINANLVLDLQCTRIPQVIDAQGTMDLFKWYYHPLVTPSSGHPVVRSVDNINLFFPSSIDTVRTKTDIKKTVILASSEYTRLQFNPVRLEFAILRYPPKPELFNKPHQPMAVLLEGVFPSLYENRVTGDMLQGLRDLNQEFKAESTPTRMMVVSDGDIAKNLVNVGMGTIKPLGYNKFERTVFGNKDFLINAIEYLIDDNGIIEARGKIVRSRLLDTVRARSERNQWQIFNILLPLIFLGAFGFFYQWRRKKKYAA